MVNAWHIFFFAVSLSTFGIAAPTSRLQSDTSIENPRELNARAGFGDFIDAVGKAPSTQKKMRDRIKNNKPRELPELYERAGFGDFIDAVGKGPSAQEKLKERIRNRKPRELPLGNGEKLKRFADDSETKLEARARPKRPLKMPGMIPDAGKELGKIFGGK